MIVLQTACLARGFEPELAETCCLLCLSPILGNILKVTNCLQGTLQYHNFSKVFVGIDMSAIVDGR